MESQWAPGKGWEPGPGLSAAGPARLTPSTDQSWGCPAWEEAINYITSSVLLLSKRLCGTDCYQYVYRATDFVDSFVHWLRKFCSNVISSQYLRWSSRALKYDLKSAQGTWWSPVMDEILVLTFDFLKWTILELFHNGIHGRYVLNETPPNIYAALFHLWKVTLTFTLKEIIAQGFLTRLL